MRPPLRWLGGKYRVRRLLGRLSEMVVTDRLIDPFLGGGSTLHIFGSPFVAGDSNSELINFHRVCVERPKELLQSTLSIPDDSSSYYRVRGLSPSTPFDRAVRFFYLNRTSYGGMYRVNQEGTFNVPYGGGGRLNVSLLTASMFEHARVLANGVLHENDFEKVIAYATSNDLLFADPPYSAPNVDTFNRYAIKPFANRDHRRLSALLVKKASEGAAVIATLPASAQVLEPFEGWRVVGSTVGRTIPQGEVVLASPTGKWSLEGTTLPAGRPDLEAFVEETKKRSADSPDRVASKGI